MTLNVSKGRKTPTQPTSQHDLCAQGRLRSAWASAQSEQSSLCTQWGPWDPRYLHQGGHWSGKSQGNLIFLQGQGKVREYCKLVREILNTKKVREKSGNFIILTQNMCCSRYFDYLKCEKSADFLKVLIFSPARFARTKL